MGSCKKIAMLKESINLDEGEKLFQEVLFSEERQIGDPYWKDNVLNMLNLRPHGGPKGGQGTVAC